MECSACGATCGPAVAGACDKCGAPFDLEATGLLLTVDRGADPSVTRLAGPPPSRTVDFDMTVASAGRHRAKPATVDLDMTVASAGGHGTTPAATASSTGPLAVGAAFGGRYHIIRMLGMGGMGAVYQAWDAELEVALALKVVRPAAPDDDFAAAEVERRFKQELLLARLVTHPNVVRIHDLGEIDGIKYITMPYIQGTDLAGVLAEKGKLPVPESLHLARQIAAGLRAAHEAGVVHRDLKPANIMIDVDRQALITDFGIARSNTSSAPSGEVRPAGVDSRLTAGHTVAGTIMGSIEYMAPEQARGEQVDQRADIYAFGLILYHMIVGRPSLSTGAEMMASLRERMGAEPAKLRTIDRTVPEALEALVSRCLQPDPAARYQTSVELVDALDRLDDEGKTLPLPVQLLKSAKFWSAAAMAAVAIIATTWLIAGRPEPPPPEPLAVLVANFKNATGEPVFDGMLEQAVTVGIEGASFITAFPRSNAERIARLINAGSRLDESASRLVAMREGIKVVLLGAVEKRGSGYTLSMQGVNQLGQVLFTSTAEARDRDAVLTAAATLATRVRNELGDTKAPDPKETLSTASLEAASAYTRAQELSSAGKHKEAIDFYRKATELDPGFGRAHGGLAMSASRLGRREEAAKLWKEALTHLDVMSEREQYRLLGMYYSLVTRNIETARDTYEKLVREYPADGAGHNNLAVSYFSLREFNKALNAGRVARQIYPNNALYRSNYALYAMYAGDFSVATEEAAKLVSDGLASYDTYLPLAMGAIANGNMDSARDAYKQMAAQDASGASLAATGLADLALAEGRPAEAITLLQAGINSDRAEDNLTGVWAKEIALADALGMQGNTAAAVAAARRALAIEATEAQILPAVRWLIAAKDITKAEELGAQLDQSLEARSRAYGRIVAAQVALARGKRVEAVDALRNALKLADLWLVRYHLGQAYLAAGAPAEAFSEFEACMKRRGEGYAVFLDDVPTARAVAPVHYWMGRAREDMGLTAQAAAEYRTYIAGRVKDSPEPLLKDAVARLASLQ